MKMFSKYVGIPRTVMGHFIPKLFSVLNILVNGFSDGVPFMYVCDMICTIKAKKQMWLN